MKKLLFCLSILLATSAFSQFHLPKEKDAVDFRKRILLVQLRVPMEEVMRKNRKDPEVLKQYERRIQLSNDLLKQSIDSYWTLNDNILFGTPGELDSIIAENNDEDYAVLLSDFGTQTMQTVQTVRERPGYLFSLYLADKRNPVFEMMVPSDILNENDHRFIIYCMTKFMTAAAEGKSQNDLSLWDPDKNLEVLSKKTLYIPEEQALVAMTEAMEHYENPLKYVRNDDLENRITHNDTNTLYPVTLFHIRKKIWMHATVDASSMDIVSMVPAESFDFVFALPLGDRFDGGMLLPVATYRIRQGFNKKYFKYTSHKMSVKMNY